MENLEKKLIVRNLKISFRTQGGKVQAIRDISFDLNKGETLALVGESGSGKSVTNRAIIGILAGNAIVESGEIIYDGQDLLKVEEEEFHKIRGDRIAMIFQDPMSSLNPIMRVGKQLTEAMLLKGKASQKNARRDFNRRLAGLNKYMDLALGEGSKEKNAQLCRTFDNFCISSTKMESAYNTAHEKIEEILSDIDELLFLIEKNQQIDIKARIKSIENDSKGVYADFLVKKDSELPNLITSLTQAVSAMKGKKAAVPADSSIERDLRKVKDLLEETLQGETPNFFCLGYYVMKNPDADVTSMPVHDLNKMVHDYLATDFMDEFIDTAAKGVAKSYEIAIQGRREALEEIEEALRYFRGDTLNRAEAAKFEGKLRAAVAKSIDEIAMRKDSSAYTFDTSFRYALDIYFNGERKNPKEQARFERQSAKHEALIERGKTPDWKVVPAAIVDLDDAKDNICHILENLRDEFKASIERMGSRDNLAIANEQVDWLKERASAVVFKMTKRLAKIRAIKLLEEVGIPEPAIRYRQYPFEFSGGMRQRIVIAIALAADPDILICDEPTTALDVTIQSQILELINKIKEKRKLSVIFITHDLGVVANMADRIAVMYAGKIVEYGTADDVFYDPRHPYTWALLSSMPDLDTKEKLEAIPGTPPNMIYPPKGDAFAARNRYALEIDFEEAPPMFKVSDSHYASTWLLHPKAPKVNPPKIVTERVERMKRREVGKNDGEQ